MNKKALLIVGIISVLIVVIILIIYFVRKKSADVPTTKPPGDIPPSAPKTPADVPSAPKTPADAPSAREYQYFPGFSSNGNDIARAIDMSVASTDTKEIDALKERCDSTQGCIAFNTDGWLKKGITARDQWTALVGANRGMYIAASHVPSGYAPTTTPSASQPQEQDTGASTITEEEQPPPEDQSATETPPATTTKPSIFRQAVPMICPEGKVADAGLCYPPCRDDYKGVGPLCWPPCAGETTDASLTCTKKSYDRGAGTAMKCPTGTEYDAGLCYPPCPATYKGVGPLCWPPCGGETTDTGLSCAKKSYERGVGVPMICPSGQETDAGLCYDPCPTGYKGVGPVCWPECSGETTDTGVACAKKSYGRGVGTPMTCPPDMIYDAGLCYPACRAGYKGVGPVCWPECSGETTDTGVACAKKSYGRGVGVPMACPPDKVYDAGLCYDPCRAGYKGVGPVCWPICDGETTDTGVACAKKSYGRGAGVPMICPTGREYDAGLCYEPCRAGYTAVGPICWPVCSGETTDTGVACAKKSYGRGAGVPMVCPTGKVYDAGLCYDPCPAGYKGVGPVCWPECSGETTDTGVACAKKSYGRGVGTAMTCATGQEYDAGLCYTPCRAGYKAVGPVCWPVCSGETTDTGVACAKKSYGRGAGTAVVASCPSDRQLWGGLCYTKCPSGGTRTASATCNFGTYGGVKTNCLSSAGITALNMGDVCHRWGSNYHKTAACTCQLGGIVTAAQWGGSVIPTYGCPAGKQNDAGLCYTPCSAGYKGVGPVCWASTCPANTTDSGVSCTKISYGRGVGVPVSTCPAGQDKSGALCYPPCNAGYTGVGPVCWASTCPANTTDSGVSCTKVAKGRGVGAPVSTCVAGQEKDGALCYPLCRTGYKGVGPVCWAATCPVNTTDSGVSCTKVTYSRGVGAFLSACASGLEKDGLLCYPPCRDGYKGVGPVCWAATCPANTTDSGVSCTKVSYGRGVGAPVTYCDPTTEKDGALCYPLCRTGYTGVGPVCWAATCPANTTDSGVSCTKVSYGRGVGDPVSYCDSTSEKSGALCYPKCRDGYTGVGPICWAATCPANTTDSGVSCTKISKGRGVGAPLSACAAGLEKSGALCYEACRTGYAGVGPVCWGTCPANTTDSGVACTKKSYSRGVGAPVSACTAEMDKSGALCYPKCRTGYAGVGPVCWAICPTDMTDTGVSCAKKSYSRGIGTPLSACAADQTKIGALCYKPCPEGTTADGILCK